MTALVIIQKTMVFFAAVLYCQNLNINIAGDNMTNCVIIIFIALGVYKFMEIIDKIDG